MDQCETKTCELERTVINVVTVNDDHLDLEADHDPMAAGWIQTTIPLPDEGGVPENDDYYDPREDWYNGADDPDNTGDSYIYPVMIEIMRSIENGIVMLVSMLLIILTVIAIGWLSVYNINAVSAEIVSRDFADAFGSIIFVVSLITNTMINDARARSTARPRMYDALLDSIMRMTRTMNGIRQSVLHTGEGHEWNTKGKGQSTVPETTSSVNQHLHDIAMYMFVMARYSYIVFQPYDPHHDYEKYVSKAEYDKYENILTSTVGETFKNEDVTNVFSNALLLIKEHVIQLHVDRVIPTGIYNDFVVDLRVITDCVHDINVSMRIATPRIFDHLSKAILFFYLIVLLPLQVYSNVSWWMVLVYPLALFIYLSNIIFGEWMGDPLMTHPRFGGGEVLAWRRQMYAVIHQLLLREIHLDPARAALHALEQTALQRSRVRGNAPVTK